MTGILSTTPQFVRYTRDLIDLMPIGKPMLIESLARISGDTIPYTRKMMWVAKSKGWVRAEPRKGRVYYIRVKQ